MDSFLFFLERGFFHVLNWNAYDHILFLIILFVGYSFGDLAKVIYVTSAFALGHIFSLLLVVYQVIGVSAKYVGFLIPGIIFIFAMYNVFTSGKAQKRGNFYFQMTLALIFGLIHGLGFEKGFNNIVGNNNKLFSILEHSLGIEAGELVASIVVLFIGFVFQTVFRFSKRDWTLVISSIVIGLVIPMLIAHKIW